jgi:hypothetical protein
MAGNILVLNRDLAATTTIHGFFSEAKKTAGCRPTWGNISQHPILLKNLRFLRE